MRSGQKTDLTTNGYNQVFGVDFHDFMQKERETNSMELAEEFGISLESVKKLKQKLHRS
jgi:hypothetical protein